MDAHQSNNHPVVATGSQPERPSRVESAVSDRTSQVGAPQLGKGSEDIRKETDSNSLVNGTVSGWISIVNDCDPQPDKSSNVSVHQTGSVAVAPVGGNQREAEPQPDQGSNVRAAQTDAVSRVGGNQAGNDPQPDKSSKVCAPPTDTTVSRVAGNQPITEPQPDKSSEVSAQQADTTSRLAGHQPDNANAPEPDKGSYQPEDGPQVNGTQPDKISAVKAPRSGKTAKVGRKSDKSSTSRVEGTATENSSKRRKATRQVKGSDVNQPEKGPKANGAESEGCSNPPSESDKSSNPANESGKSSNPASQSDKSIDSQSGKTSEVNGERDSSAVERGSKFKTYDNRLPLFLQGFEPEKVHGATDEPHRNLKFLASYHVSFFKIHLPFVFCRLYLPSANNVFCKKSLEWWLIVLYRIVELNSDCDS